MMFKILTKGMNIHELRALTKLWGRMIEMFENEFCSVNHDDCRYRKLCASLYRTNTYLNTTLIEREKEEANIDEQKTDGND